MQPKRLKAVNTAGSSTDHAAASIETRLEKVDMLHANGRISDEEYQCHRHRILSEI